MNRQKLEWLYLALLVAAIGAIFAYLQNAEFARTRSAEQLRLDVLGKVLASEVGTHLVATNQALGGVLRDHMSGAAPPDAAVINRRLQALQEAMPQIRGLTVIDAQGTVVASIPRDLMGRNFAARPYFTKVREHPDRATVFISPPFMSVRGDKVMSITRMVPTRSGQFGGVVSAVLDPGYFTVLLKTVLYAPDVTAFVAHGDGETLLRVSASGQPQSGAASAVVRVVPVAPAGLRMDTALLIGITRDDPAIVAPLRGHARVLATFLGMLALLAAALLRWAQLRQQRNRQFDEQQRRERARADALSHSEARFRTLIEEAPVAVAILRAGTFIYTNRRYNLLHGYCATDDLVGQPWRAMIAPASLAALGEQEAAIVADAPLEQRFEALGVGKDATPVPVLKATTRVALIDGPATLVFAQDISPQKHAEAALLEARDAAQAANASKAAFLSNMSHEIRTPLNAILGMAYLLEQAQLDADAHGMLLKIRASGKSLLAIINDVLDLSKIDAGQMTIETAWFSLQQVIDDVAATMGVAVGEKDVTLLVHPLPQDFSRLLGDPLRLEQILSNLTSNAIKFTHCGSVEMSVTVVGRSAERLTLRFCVRDTGIGIPAHLQESIFSPFTQADSSTTRRFGGSGLGLTICKRLAELLGGTIGVDSVPGQGSDFWFTLPFAFAAPAGLSSPEMARIHILIVHENAHALASIAGSARALGWHVSTAASNREAIERILAAGAPLPDVIVLNRPARDQGSVATARAIRAAVPPGQCPVVILTSTYELSESAGGPDAAAVDAFLTKPVTASTLYNAVIKARRQRGAAALAAPAPLRHDNTVLAGIRLLVVDDSDINRDVARRILCGAGAEVVLAEHGQAALDWLLAHPDEIDLVLMDVQMPVLDGIDACRALRALPQFADLPIVALTAGAFQWQEEAARAAGMSEFITKPFDIPLTIALVRRLHRPAPHGAPRVIDLQRGMELWGDTATHNSYLHRFGLAFGDAGRQLREALAGAPGASAAAIAHKLAGAAANVALIELAGAAMALEARLAPGAAPPGPDALDALDAALARAIVAIAQRLPATRIAPDAGMASPAIPGTDLAGILDALLAALHTDNPAPALPLLDRLRGSVPAAPLAAISEAVAVFDFRFAERATCALTHELGLTLKGAAWERLSS